MKGFHHIARDVKNGDVVHSNSKGGQLGAAAAGRTWKGAGGSGSSRPASAAKPATKSK